jgi:hypothetical protein
MIELLRLIVPENYLNRAEIIHKLLMNMLNVMSNAPLYEVVQEHSVKLLSDSLTFFAVRKPCFVQTL